MKTIYDIRRDNLRAYIDTHGTQAGIAKTLGMGSGSFLSQILGNSTKRKDINEKLARDWETKLGLPNGWFDEARDGYIRNAIAASTKPMKAAEPALTPYAAAEAAAVVLDTLAEKGLKKPTSVVQQTIEMALESKLSGEELRDYINRLVRLMA